MKKEAIQLLQNLIAIESFSGNEDRAADFLADFICAKNISVNRLRNNVWCKNLHFDKQKPTILLNSHLDTVKPAATYTRNPFKARIERGKLYGLGSNDAGGALVALLTCFLEYYDKNNLKYNLLFAATAEEEISGKNGVELLLPELGEIAFGIVGEPTQMNMAIAEKGLLVLDCTVQGKAGHAAREEGVNAIYESLADIEWFRTYQFPKISELLGPVKMTVSMINSGSQHNIVPGICSFTVDIRTTELYTHAEILETIHKHTRCKVKPRSFRLQPSFIYKSHPLVQAGIKIGRSLYGSPTTSDQALMPFPTLKMGPGDSARSHMSNEYIYIVDIERGIDLYKKLFNKILK